jgi:glutamate-1-semialdehyde 2,1-aminomutase
MRAAMTDAVSAELFRRAQERFPGGVNSPVRAFRAVGGTPVFVDRAEGAYLWGADGTRYVDYVGSWGPMILGHAHPAVVTAVQEAMTRGASYGAPTAQETDLADLVAAMVPSIEMMRFTSSGTEAVMGALRVARGFTGRDLVVKFEGCYHGGADYLLVKAGSGLATFGVPTSAGVPASIASTCAVLPYNDEGALERLFAERGAEIAAVILEPVVGNMGTVPPSRAFLDALRAQTTKHGALLVFDEVMTGFRVARGGAQELFGVRPDLTTLGKIAGGGLPLGVYGGRRDVMEKVAPLGPVYQAGTLSGNPLAVAAGLATLRILSEETGLYDRLERASADLESILLDAAGAAKANVCIQRTGSMITPFFTEGPVRSWEDAARCDTAAFGRWHRAMLDNGVMWPPAQFEAAFVSAAHDATALQLTARAATAAFAAV